MEEMTTGPVRTAHLIDAHLTYPQWSEGGLTDSLLTVARDHLRQRGVSVTETEVERGYDPASEVERYLAADVVILHTPINWFGAPWTYKRYVDEVFNSGLHSRALLDGDGRTRRDPNRQYGTGGHMHGRGFFVASTWNAPADVFENPDSVLFAGSKEEDLLLNITANYRFVGFTGLQNYGVHDIFRAPDVAEQVDNYRFHLDRQLDTLARLRSQAELRVL